MTPHDLSDLLADLVRIDSQNPELVPGAPGERAIAEFCVQWFGRHGVDAWLDEVAPGRVNAVARIVGGDGPTLAFCAHLDTVSIEGMSEPGLEPRVDGGRMYGRGAYDMKCGVAAIMSAMAALAKEPPHGTVLAALVCDEEYASIGASDFVRRYPCDGCIVTEPSEGALILAHKGFVWATIETVGVAAHGSRWQDGVSAIGRMAPIISALEQFDRDVLRTRTHPLLGPASLHCAMIEGGDGWSTYAPHCSLRVERRTLPGESSAAVIDELRAVIAGAGGGAAASGGDAVASAGGDAVASAGGAAASGGDAVASAGGAAASGGEPLVREVLSRSPLECAPGSPVARAVSSSIAAVTGSQPDIAGVAYWMDAAIFADAGADTVDYGPTGAGAHGAMEWVELESVVRCARVLFDAAHRFNG